jgi:hypothetical protein
VGLIAVCPPLRDCGPLSRGEVILLSVFDHLRQSPEEEPGIRIGFGLRTRLPSRATVNDPGALALTAGSCLRADHNLAASCVGEMQKRTAAFSAVLRLCCERDAANSSRRSPRPAPFSINTSASMQCLDKIALQASRKVGSRASRSLASLEMTIRSSAAKSPKASKACRAADAIGFDQSRARAASRTCRGAGGDRTHDRGIMSPLL